MKTPQDLSALANLHQDSADAEVRTWLADASSRNILTFLSGLLVGKYERHLPVATAALNVRLAEDAAKQADRLEKQMLELVGIAAEQERLALKLDGQTETIIRLTKKLNRLTIWLVILTVALVLFEVMHFIESRQIAPRGAQIPHQVNQEP